MTSESLARPANTAERLRAELTFMYELCQVVASHSELQPILDWIVQTTTRMLAADEGSIRLLSPDLATPTLKTLIRTETAGIESGSWPSGIAMNVMGFLMAKGVPLATPDLLDDPQFPSLKNQQTRIRAVLAVPLRVDNRFTGMLAVTQATPGRQWTEDEKQLLTIVASNSASVIEQARLKIESEEKRRLEEQQRLMDRELDTARKIQEGLTPSHALKVGPWEVMGRIIPARQVGGDAFDYYLLEEGRFSVAIADVSGKGVPAALLMSNVQASLRAFCNGRTPIPDAMRQLNSGLSRSASNGKFITLFYAEVDPVAGVVRYSNAGHNYPLLRRADGSLEELMEGGLPLGLMADATYLEGETTMGPGDALLLYSDGISEAFDPRGREFGEDRLREVWSQNGDSPSATAIERLFREVETFRAHAVQSDDMTIVVVGRPAAS